MKTIGIIGFGGFGKFLAEKLSSHAKVIVYSPSGTPGSWVASMADIVQADYAVPAIPLENYAQVLSELKPLLRPDTVIVDVCSVKAKPVEIAREVMISIKDKDR